MKKTILAAALFVASTATAQAVTCTSSGFAGGIPPVVSEITISDDAGNSVDVTDFDTKAIYMSDPDNASETIVYDEFTFGATALSQIENAGLALTSGTKISAESGDLEAEVVCD